MVRVAELIDEAWAGFPSTPRCVCGGVHREVGVMRVSVWGVCVVFVGFCGGCEVVHGVLV